MKNPSMPPHCFPCHGPMRFRPAWIRLPRATQGFLLLGVTSLRALAARPCPVVPRTERAGKYLSVPYAILLGKLWLRNYCLHFLCAKSLQLCPTLCDPMDCSPLGSSVHGIPQARILEWVAVSYSRDLPDIGTEPKSLTSPALAGGFFTSLATWEAINGP